MKIKKNFSTEESNASLPFLNQSYTEYSSTDKPSFTDFVSASFEEGMRFSPLNNIIESATDLWTSDSKEEKLDPKVLNSMYPDMPEKFQEAMTPSRAADIVAYNKKSMRNQQIIKDMTDESVLYSAANFAIGSVPAMFDPINYAGGRLVGMGASALSGITGAGKVAKIASSSANNMAVKIAKEGLENTAANIAIDATINNPILKKNLDERDTEGYIANAAIAGFGLPIAREAMFRPVSKLINKVRGVDPEIDTKIANIVEQQVANDKQINISDALKYSYDNARSGERISGVKKFIDTPDLRYSVNFDDVTKYNQKFPRFSDIDIPAYLKERNNTIEVKLDDILDYQIEKSNKTVYSSDDAKEIPVIDIPRKPVTIDRIKERNGDIYIVLEDIPRKNILDLDAEVAAKIRENIKTKEFGDVVSPLDLFKTNKGTSFYFDLIPHMETDRFNKFILDEKINIDEGVTKYSPQEIKSNVNFEDLNYTFVPSKEKPTVKEQFIKANSDTSDMHSSREVDKLEVEAKNDPPSIERNITESLLDLDEEIKAKVDAGIISEAGKEQFSKITQEKTLIDSMIKNMQSCILQNFRGIK